MHNYFVSACDQQNILMVKHSNISSYIIIIISFNQVNIAELACKIYTENPLVFHLEITNLV